MPAGRPDLAAATNAQAARPERRPEPGWVILERRVIAPGAVADMLAIHQRTGVAILEVAPHWNAGAITLLRGTLAHAGFQERFPGHLPVIHRRIRREDLAVLRELLNESFLWQPALTIDSGAAWIPVLDALLPTAPPPATESARDESARDASGAEETASPPAVPAPVAGSTTHAGDPAAFEAGPRPHSAEAAGRDRSVAAPRADGTGPPASMREPPARRPAAMRWTAVAGVAGVLALGAVLFVDGRIMRDGQRPAPAEDATAGRATTEDPSAPTADGQPQGQAPTAGLDPGAGLARPTAEASVADASTPTAGGPGTPKVLGIAPSDVAAARDPGIADNAGAAPDPMTAAPRPVDPPAGTSLVAAGPPAGVMREDATRQTQGAAPRPNAAVTEAATPPADAAIAEAETPPRDGVTSQPAAVPPDAAAIPPAAAPQDAAPASQASMRQDTATTQPTSASREAATRTDPAPQEAITQTDPAPQGAITQTDPAPQEAITQTDPAPQEAITQTDPAPQEAITQTDPALQGAPTQSDPAPQGAPTRSDPAPQGAPTQSDPALQGATTRTDLALQGAPTAPPDAATTDRPTVQPGMAPEDAARVEPATIPQGTIIAQPDADTRGAGTVSQDAVSSAALPPDVPASAPILPPPESDPISILDPAQHALAGRDHAAPPSTGSGSGAATALPQMSPTPGATDPAALRPTPPQRPPSPAAVALTARGKALLALGDVSGARLLFTRSAEAGHGEAALLLGSTFDPLALEALGMRGIAADPAQARHWYERAARLGEAQAASRLQGLETAPQAGRR